MAWHPLGWRPAFFSEIERFPSAVLAHHYPDVPNLGDMTKFKEWPDYAIDLLVGGTPCQSFSVAGLRKGLDDPRGNLALVYLAILERYRPRWCVWENVPGVLSSNEGRDFGAFIGALGKLGYGFAYRVLDAQFVRTRRHPGAVPQRRRRVFVVGYTGDWRRAAAVLFDPESVQGNSPPRREAGKNPAPTISARTPAGGGLGTDFDLDGGLTVSHALRGEGFDASEDGSGRGTPIATSPACQTGLSKYGADVPTLRAAGGDCGGGSEALIPAVANPLTARMYKGINTTLDEGQTPIAIQERAVSENPHAGPDGAGIRTDGAAYTLEARSVSQAVALADYSRVGRWACSRCGHVFSDEHAITPNDANSLCPPECDRCGNEEDNCWLGGKPGQTPIAIAFHGAQDPDPSGDVTHPLGRNNGLEACVAFDCKATEAQPREDGAAGTLRSMSHNGSHANAGGHSAVAFTASAQANSYAWERDHAPCLTGQAPNDTSNVQQGVRLGMQVRRLTPRECERLQGFPDDFSLIPYRGKPAENCPAGPRYKALGNSMAVNVMQWIGERIALVDALAIEMEQVV